MNGHPPRRLVGRVRASSGPHAPQQTTCAATRLFIHLVGSDIGQGLGALFLKEQPWSYSRRSTKHDYEQAALRQGHVAVSTALRGNYRGRSSFTNAATLGRVCQAFTRISITLFASS